MDRCSLKQGKALPIIKALALMVKSMLMKWGAMWISKRNYRNIRKSLTIKKVRALEIPAKSEPQVKKIRQPNVMD